MATRSASALPQCLGPQFAIERERLRIAAGLGLGLNIASWRASTEETLSTGEGKVLARWRERSSGSEVLPGLYLQANAAYALSNSWSLSAFGRYDWSQPLEQDLGASSFTQDLTGWTLGAGVQYAF